jgi:predicted SAM-dependent methyltransferase
MINSSNDFSEFDYLVLNPDVRLAVEQGGFLNGLDHFKKFGYAENRQTRGVSREAAILSLLSKEGYGLEIGPSHNPIAPKAKGWKVHTVDHDTQENLRKKYANHNVNVAAIEPVDFVIQSGTLGSTINATAKYDWIIASHVFEHLPNPIQFLVDCAMLLKNDGILSLAIPDKQRCFDIFRPTTSVGQMVDAFKQERTRPTYGQILDHHYFAAHRNGSIAWDENALGSIKMCHDISDVLAILDIEKIGDPQYRDVHCWTFTPSSFKTLYLALTSLALIQFKISLISETRGFEFFVSLRKKNKILMDEIESREDSLLRNSV